MRMPAAAAGPPAGETDGATEGAAAACAMRARGPFGVLCVIRTGTEVASIDHDLPGKHPDGTMGETFRRPVHAVVLLRLLVHAEVPRIVCDHPARPADGLRHKRPVQVEERVDHRGGLAEARDAATEVQASHDRLLYRTSKARAPAPATP